MKIILLCMLSYWLGMFVMYDPRPCPVHGKEKVAVIKEDINKKEKDEPLLKKGLI